MQFDTLINNQKSKPLQILFAVVFSCLYILTEPTLNSMYFLYCTYRVQTMVIVANYAILAITYLLYFHKLYTAFREKARIDLGIIGPYSLVFAGYLIATLANPDTGNLARWSDTFFYSLIPLIISFLFLSDYYGKRFYISAVAWIYLVLSLLNIVFSFFPQLYIGEAKDWREEFFLGFENKAGWALIMGAFFSLIDWKLNGHRWKTVAYFISLLVNIKLIWCITALLGTFIVICYIVLPFVRKWFQKWDFLIFIGIILTLFLCFMFFQKYTVSSEPVALFIEEVLHKKRSMSGRLPLWKLGVAIVLQKPWLGVGAQLHPGFIHMADEYGVWSYYHAHNELLQTWYEGGVLTVVLSIIMLIYVADRLRNGAEEYKGICKLMLFVFLFMLLSDNMPYYPWYMVAFVSNISILISKKYNSEADNSRASVLAEQG